MRLSEDAPSCLCCKVGSRPGSDEERGRVVLGRTVEGEYRETASDGW